MSERCLTKLFFLTFYSTLPITGTVPTYKDFRSKLSMNSLFISHTSVAENLHFCAFFKAGRKGTSVFKYQPNFKKNIFKKSAVKKLEILKSQTVPASLPSVQR